MTNKELAAALRLCGSVRTCDECLKCPFFEGCDPELCIPKMTAACADALENSESHVMALQQEIEKLRAKMEALLDENERLKADKDKNVPIKWVSVEERLPKHDEEVLVLTAPGTLSLGQNQVVAEYIHPINEKFGVFINFYAGYDDKNLLSVTHWQPLPEPPSTEGVE